MHHTFRKVACSSRVKGNNFGSTMLSYGVSGFRAALPSERSGESTFIFAIGGEREEQPSAEDTASRLERCQSIRTATYFAPLESRIPGTMHQEKSMRF